MKFFFLFFLACTCACQVSSQSLRSAVTTYQTQQDATVVEVCEETEPGERMSLLVQLVRAEDQQPIPHAAVFLYHTTTTGVYETAVPQDPSTARLQASFQTDSEGRFLLQTIVPGQYPNTSNDPHIHLQNDAATPPYYNILFAHNLSKLGRLSANRKDQLFIAEMEQVQGHWFGVVTVQLKNYSKP